MILESRQAFLIKQMDYSLMIIPIYGIKKFIIRILVYRSSWDAISSDRNARISHSRIQSHIIQKYIMGSPIHIKKSE